MKLITYRLQLNKNFNFQQVIEILDYLKDLGITHLYLSPILQARKGSSHGYDVFDFTKINEELGGEEKFIELSKKAREKGIGIILDIVPNHMALENPYMMDVLKYGKNSTYAKFFDIDWSLNKILLPILGNPEDIKKLRIEKQDNSFYIRYYELKLPIKDDSIEKIKNKYSCADEECLNKHLQEILEDQNYELIFWKESSNKINYRRFFDVNGLIALREEDEDVFNEVHKKIFQLVKEGYIEGLRVDHIDGLYDPKQYIERLRANLGNIYLFVEKILGENERLRDWKIEGTTGYDFLKILNLLFIKNMEKMRKIYYNFTGIEFSKDLLVREKRKVIDQLFKGDIERLLRITGLSEDYRETLINFLVCINIYRTYVENYSWIDTEVIKNIEECSKDSKILNLLNNKEILQRIEQFSPAVMAKGIEDTFFYYYNPLISQNEVGGTPWLNGISCVDFHLFNIEREILWPNSMLTTSTHDTKLSEDVRARINVLSEIPDEWEKKLLEWSKFNEKFVTIGPTKNDEYRFYQVLLGTWNGYSNEYKERLINYMFKAIREEKENTFWIEPNIKYENAVKDFIEKALNNQLFMNSFLDFWKKIDFYGKMNSIIQTTLKLTLPGVPDIYQGNESFTYLMVDPDNRRQVNFVELKNKLNNIKKNRHLDDKLYVTWKILNLRKKDPEAFSGYKPLEVEGSNNICGFMRRGILVIFPRFVTEAYPFKDKLKNTFMKLDGDFIDILTDNQVKITNNINVSELFSDYPIVILYKK
ncbi:malto-oligosyltrehalose synthase [Acidianus brierleyi]|uniref:Malto-oligosyltrehalose synthase n=1 Tax=Acidianus brierleyi TaxID=41673 RepID=A0A2U9IGN2_9CREN|nr:malto-oligosyltrehalose synthase [Acidianus brierleyi]